MEIKLKMACMLTNYWMLILLPVTKILGHAAFDSLEVKEITLLTFLLRMLP